MDYIFQSEKIGEFKAGRVGIVGKNYVMEFTPSRQVAERTDSDVAVEINLLEVGEGGVALAPEPNADLNTNGEGVPVSFLIEIPTAAGSGDYRGQIIIPYQAEDIDGEGGERDEFIHWDFRVRKLGEISKSTLDRLWEAVNLAIENRLSQKVSADAGTTFSTDGISMSFATFTELTDFRRELGAERNYKRTGGIDQRRVFFNGFGI